MATPGFFDPNGAGDGPGRIVLERFVEDGRELFALLEPIGYRDHHHRLWRAGLVTGLALALLLHATLALSLLTALFWLVERATRRLDRL